MTSHPSQDALLRLKDIVGDRKARPPIRGLLPIGASTWWELVQSGEVPKPLKIGRASFWRSKDVHRLIERLDRDGAITLPRRKLRRATLGQPVSVPRPRGGRTNADS